MWASINPHYIPNNYLRGSSSMAHWRSTDIELLNIGNRPIVVVSAKAVVISSRCFFFLKVNSDTAHPLICLTLRYNRRLRIFRPCYEWEKKIKKKHSLLRKEWLFHLHRLFVGKIIENIKFRTGFLQILDDFLSQEFPNYL